MRTVLSAFADRDVAEAAVERLRASDLTSGDIEIHVRHQGEDPSLGNPIDELVTGGALTNFSHLLDHLFGSANSALVDKSLASEVRDGGAVVIVDALDDAEAERVQAFLREAGAAKQAHMAKEGDLD